MRKTTARSAQSSGARGRDREGVYNVRVAESVGVIGVLSRLQIEVNEDSTRAPCHLMELAEEVPRMDEQRAEVDLGYNLIELISAGLSRLPRSCFDGA